MEPLSAVEKLHADHDLPGFACGMPALVRAVLVHPKDNRGPSMAVADCRGLEASR